MFAHNTNVEKTWDCWCGPIFSEALQKWLHRDITVPQGTVHLITQPGVVMDSQEPVIRDIAKGGVEYPGDMIAVKTLRGMPRAWLELIQAIALLAKHATDDISPFHCEHDVLSVMADPGKFTVDERQQLKEWGFFVSEEWDGFYSFRYGSA